MMANSRAAVSARTPNVSTRYSGIKPINEAARVVEEKVADIKDVDIAIKYGLNLPEGPFEILHRLGKDTILETLCILEKKSGRAYSPSPILSNL